MGGWTLDTLPLRGSGNETISPTIKFEGFFLKWILQEVVVHKQGHE